MILLFILASRKVFFLVFVDDDIFVHPGIQESLFFFVVGDDMFVHPGIQEMFFVDVDDDFVVHPGIQESNCCCGCCWHH